MKNICLKNRNVCVYILMGKLIYRLIRALSSFVNYDRLFLKLYECLHLHLKICLSHFFNSHNHGIGIMSKSW